MSDFDDEGWDPEALAGKLASSMSLEEQLHPNEDNKDRAYRLLEESAPQAALSLVELALRGHSESIRFRAASYIIERALGRVVAPKEEAKEDWEELLTGVLSADE